MSSEELSTRRRWAVVAGTWTVYASFGMVVAATGALVPEIRSSLGLSNTEMGFVLGAWQLVYIWASIPGGRAIDRIGPRRAILAGAICIAVSGLARAAVGGFGTLLLAVGLLGVGAPIISIGAPAVAANLFDGDRRRLAVAIYSTAPSIGSIVGLILATSVLERFVGDDWRTILALLASVSVAVCALWFVLARPLDAAMAPGGGPSLADYVGIAKLPVMRFVLTLAAINFYFTHGIGQWQVDILASAGWGKAQAGYGAALSAVVGMAASFVVPRMAAPDRRQSLMIAGLVVGSVGALGLAASNVALIGVGLTATGASRIVLMPLLMMVMMDDPAVGPRAIAAGSGLYFTIAQLGGVAGPAVTGALNDATGGFTVPLVADAVAMLATAAGIGVFYRRLVAYPPERDSVSLEVKR